MNIQSSLRPCRQPNHLLALSVWHPVVLFFHPNIRSSSFRYYFFYSKIPIIEPTPTPPTPSSPWFQPSPQRERAG